MTRNTPAQETQNPKLDPILECRLGLIETAIQIAELRRDALERVLTLARQFKATGYTSEDRNQVTHLVALVNAAGNDPHAFVRLLN